MSIKDQIRAEIERRINSLEKDWLGAAAARWAFEEILKYIDTLPAQPVEGLEEEMDEIWLEYCEDVDYLVYASIARHFAEWGAEHIKK